MLFPILLNSQSEVEFDRLKANHFLMNRHYTLPQSNRVFFQRDIHPSDYTRFENVAWYNSKSYILRIELQYVSNKAKYNLIQKTFDSV